MPALAEATWSERAFFRGNEVRAALSDADGYAFDVARREELDRRSGYLGYDDEAEEARRRDALAGAQRLARDAQAAQARDVLREDLLADAFGVAAWSIGVKPGEDPGPERLAMISDERLRFVLGFAMPATAEAGVP